MGRAFVVGVGMTKFEKPGKRNDDYPVFAKEAITKALDDSKVKFSEVELAICGNVYGCSTSGQRAVYEIGMTGIPIFNVNNNCSTGSTALLLAKDFVEFGKHDCVLAVGFEKMRRGQVFTQFSDRAHPAGRHVRHLTTLTKMSAAAPITAQIFGTAGIEHMKKYGTTPEQFAKIAYKNHKHSLNNLYSQFREGYSLDQIKRSPQVSGPLTKFQCCPTSDGGAAAIIASETFVKRHGLQSQAVEILGMEMVTDFPSTFEKNSSINLVGYDMTKIAAERLFYKTNTHPTDVQVIELHDCFSVNELLSYEALGLCLPGKGGELVDRCDNTYGGKYVINPSGGLIAKGHPLGATGLAQCVELCLQLRGEAEERQVQGTKLALQHNFGIGGAVVVALYKLGFPEYNKKRTRLVKDNDNLTVNEKEVSVHSKL